MASVFILLGLLAGGYLAAVMLLVHRVAAAGRKLPVTAEWIGELSVERYRPMLTLLDGKDIEFLKSQPGFTPRMAIRLRIQRCQVFREYLRCLSADFGRTCAAVKVLMLQSKNDRPELAGLLVRSQAVFACGIIGVQARLLCYRFGIGAVDAEILVSTFDAMRVQLRSLVPVEAMLVA